jgi:hypothetical protein
MLVVGVLVLCGIQLVAQDSASPEPTVRQAVGFAVSPPLRDLAKLPRAPQYGLHEALPVRRIAKRYFGLAVDPVEQNTAIGAPVVNYSIGLDFLGVGNGFPGYTVPDAPPDTNMAVGDTQIVQWVNVSFAVFNKFNGATLAGPIDGNLLWSALNDDCSNNNDGDIIAQWDNSAHRWLLAQNVFHLRSGLTPPYYACVAVSTTNDATGSYYVYEFSLGNGFPDYPKWGRWIDTWTQTMNNFGPSGSGFVGAEVCAYERSKLLAGAPSPRQVCFQLSSQDDSLLPADIDSPTNPPSECQFFIGSLGNVINTKLSLYSMCINWLHPSQAYMTGNNNSQLTTVPVYTGSCQGNFGGYCVPQKGISDMLDSLGDRLMYRFAYYNDAAPAGKQHWYVNHAVEATLGQIGVRWYEFQAPKIAITPLYFTSGTLPSQAGTYAPDSNYRWMGSIAADMNNDILVGYSESSSSLYPSIDVAGRLKNDVPNTLEAEVSVVAGTGSQPDTRNRWGDYSAMRLDPDGCTFWYTTEYYMVTQQYDWSTQIANIKFAGCHNPAYDGYIELCKQTDPDFPVSGTFNFTLTEPFFSTGPIGVPVGSCSPPIRVPSGIVTITEAPQIGVAVEDVTAYSYDQFGNYIDELDSWTPPEQTATVTVMPGGVNLETIATFTNYAAPPGTLKICKIAGPGITIGTPFTFTATDGTTQHRDTVNAGPPPGGNCVIDGTWPVNDPVTVTETPIPPGVSVSNITVEPPDRGGPPNLSGGYVTVTIGSGFTEVDFTDTGLAGSCNPSSSMSVLQVNGPNVVAYVPLSYWAQNPRIPNIVATDVEGNYIANHNGGTHYYTVLINDPSGINSCASDPTLGQTVCVANGNQVYVVENTLGGLPQVTHQLSSSGQGILWFSGSGNYSPGCTNCGVTMDAIHHKALIGVALNGPPLGLGQPGFQFLRLGSTPILEPPIVSPARQISEDTLIDPIRQLLLSPAEGASLSCVPPGNCHPNYEIAQITYPSGGNSALQFYENQIYQDNDYPGGFPDAAAAECTLGIAMASIERPTVPNQNPSAPYIADLTQAVFDSVNGTWTDPAHAYFRLTGSVLDDYPGAAASGPIAIAQGGSLEGVLGMEGPLGYPKNTITAFKLSSPFNGSYADWVTCNLGTDPISGIVFQQGADPHTVTAYQSPNSPNHSFAVLANLPSGNSVSALAVVDLDMMLNSSIVPRWSPPYGHVCRGGGPPGTPGVLPQTPPVVRFVCVGGTC